MAIVTHSDQTVNPDRIIWGQTAPHNCPLPVVAPAETEPTGPTSEEESWWLAETAGENPRDSWPAWTDEWTWELGPDLAEPEPPTMAERGRKGGNATVRRHGAQHMADIGRIGFRRLAQKYQSRRAAVVKLQGKGKMPCPYPQRMTDAEIDGYYEDFLAAASVESSGWPTDRDQCRDGIG